MKYLYTVLLTLSSLLSVVLSSRHAELLTWSHMPRFLCLDSPSKNIQGQATLWDNSYSGKKEGPEFVVLIFAGNYFVLICKSLSLSSREEKSEVRKDASFSKQYHYRLPEP